MKLGQTKIQYGGFTVLELLTVMAVIGVLLALLIPALNQVSKTANRVKQKAQFHAIGTALEAFRNDYGDYPPSVWDPVYGNYCASQRLAEALVGRDGLGFHSLSQFLEDGTTVVPLGGFPPSVGPREIYYPKFQNYLDSLPVADRDAAKRANLALRKGPYLELESANAVELSNISASLANIGIDTSTLVQDGYVLVDMYKQIKNAATGKEVGMPILYYRADRMKIGHDPTPPWVSNTYNFNDSYCVGVGFISNMAAADEFYKAIANPNFTSPVRPYRAESFILQSAGPDGLYGTADDVFNFDQEK